MALLSDIKIMMLKGEKGDKGDGSYDDTEIRGLIQDEAIARAEDIAELEAHFLEYLYPIGSIFMSVNDTSPAVLFGGTWEKIEGRFLAGAGTSRGTKFCTDGIERSWSFSTVNGETAGCPFDHIDTEISIDPINNIKKHHHTIKSTHATLASGTAYDGFIIDNSGTSNSFTEEIGSDTVQPTLHGGTSYVNMLPPFLTVNIWKRTA